MGGCAVAGRLAENGTFRVLGIEWGDRTHRSLNGTDYVASDLSFDENGDVVVGTPLTRFDVPIFAPAITTTPPVPYPALSVVLNGVVSQISIAKLLGGTGAHNGMVWTRFTQDSINAWGVTGWSYNDVLPFYKKSENVTGSTEANNTYYHGLTGPIRISNTPQTDYFSINALLEQACVNMGLPINPDFNGATRYGCGSQVFNIGDGIRYSTAQGYLPKVLPQGNLQLALKARSTRILIKPGASATALPIAYGVEYLQNGTLTRVFANKEIIVAQSSIFTPQLLLLSGIGPAADLKKLNITVWVNNSNVGKNLQSNQQGETIFTYPNAPFGSDLGVSGPANEYAFNRTGPWSFASQFTHAYVCSNGTNCSNPDVHIAVYAGDTWGAGPAQSIIALPCTATPHVRGSVSLLSSNPFDLVNVTINSYDNPQDLNSEIFAHRFVRQWFGTYPASTAILQELYPGEQIQSDAQWAAFVKANTAATAHWVGTSKFGNTGDPTRVTDPQLRVVGIQGLRVSDGSVFPTVNSHLQASATMAGERCADFILHPPAV